ncbi:MAG: NUDIX domain-containing protein [Candidatus Methanofastidiosia archaeon]
MRYVVTSFLRYENRYLIVKRSNDVSSYKKKWGAISGSINENESVIDAAYREILEETGILSDSLSLVHQSNNIHINYGYFEWVVHPLLFNCCNNIVRLNWENIEYTWALYGEIPSYDTVPGLFEALDSLLHDF